MPELTLQPGPADSYDNYIDEADPGSVFNTEEYVYVKTASGARRQALLQFDLSTLPERSVIAKAELKLYCDYDEGAGRVFAHEISQVWYTDTVCWDNRPIPGLPAHEQDAEENTWVIFDVTDIVQEWSNISEYNLGFQIKSDECEDLSFRFKSGDFVADPTKRPILYIEYTTYGPAELMPPPHAETHKGDGSDPIDVATTTVDGLMSAEDKAKLDADTPGEGHIVLSMFGEVNTSGTWVLGVDANSLYNGYKYNSSNADGNYIEFKAYLAAGTYTMKMFCLTSQNNGKIDFVSSAFTTFTIDQYSAGLTYNVVRTQTGITVATSGLYTIKLLLNGKTGSPGGYYCYFSQIDFYRTA